MFNRLPWPCASMVQSRRNVSGRHTRAQLGHVPLQVGSDELLPPLGALPVALRQKAPRKSAADPQPRRELAAGLADIQRGELEIRDASRQGLTGLPQQIRSGRSEQQELSGRFAGSDPLVDERAQQLEQPGRALHLVDNDEPALESPQVAGRVVQFRQIGGLLQIEVHAVGGGGQPPRQRRLADLPRPDQGDGGELPEAGGDDLSEGSGDHLAIGVPTVRNCKVTTRADSARRSDQASSARAGFQSADSCPGSSAARLPWRRFPARGKGLWGGRPGYFSAEYDVGSRIRASMLSTSARFSSRSAAMMISWKSS